MPKKEKPWVIGHKGTIGPWAWNVWLKGNKKPIKMVAFDVQHIEDQLEGRQIVKAKKLPEDKDNFRDSPPLGPKGSVVHQPADYDAGFKILRAWVDENGGPPEEIRQKLRELWIDYERKSRKTTRSSAKKNGRHKI